MQLLALHVANLALCTNQGPGRLSLPAHLPARENTRGVGQLPVRTAEPSPKGTPRTPVCFFLSAPNLFTSILAGVDEPSNHLWRLEFRQVRASSAFPFFPCSYPRFLALPAQNSPGSKTRRFLSDRAARRDQWKAYCSIFSGASQSWVAPICLRFSDRQAENDRQEPALQYSFRSVRLKTQSDSPIRP